MKFELNIPTELHEIKLAQYQKFLEIATLELPSALNKVSLFAKIATTLSSQKAIKSLSL